METIFQEACQTHKCPKCTGFVAGPLWDGTLQGKVYTAYCVNCGWRENSELYFIDYSMDKTKLPGHIQQMKRATRGIEVIRIQKRKPLSQYDWGEEK
jgi:hypothetical protein